MLLTIKEYPGLNADKHGAKEVTLGYCEFFELVGFIFFLAISADVNGPSSGIDDDDTFTSLGLQKH